MSKEEYEDTRPAWKRSEDRVDWWRTPGLNISPACRYYMENKEALQAKHSHATETAVFKMDCSSCYLWYKPCMFSSRERKEDPECRTCRWCNCAEFLGNEVGQFCIHKHVNCNTAGKTCGA